MPIAFDVKLVKSVYKQAMVRTAKEKCNRQTEQMNERTDERQ
jgi:hypothetical protein